MPTTKSPGTGQNGSSIAAENVMQSTAAVIAVANHSSANTEWSGMTETSNDGQPSIMETNTDKPANIHDDELKGSN